MIEVIKHTLGICGEHWHPNLLTLLIGGASIGTTIKYSWSYIKCRVNNLIKNI